MLQAMSRLETVAVIGRGSEFSSSHRVPSEGLNSHVL